MVPSGNPSSAAVFPKTGRLLGIDYGRRRLGLALSDEMQVVVRPLRTLVRTSRRNDLRRLREIVRGYAICRIVVGHPVRLDGTRGEMAEEAARFAARIEKELAVPVVLADERLSTWEARQVKAKTKGARKKNENLDSVAAAVVLQDYLAARAQAGS